MSRIAPVAVALLLLLAGCSAKSDSGTVATSSSTTATSAVATSTTAKLTGKLQAHADGRFPAYIKAVDPSRRLLVVDEIQFLTGDAAKAAYKADNPQSQEDAPPNDYYIKNVNPLLTTVTVSPSAKITVNVLAGTGGPDDTAVDLKTLAGYFNDRPQPATTLPFWITVTGGAGTTVAEQFVP